MSQCVAVVHIHDMLPRENANRTDRERVRTHLLCSREFKRILLHKPNGRIIFIDICICVRLSGGGVGRERTQSSQSRRVGRDVRFIPLGSRPATTTSGRVFVHTRLVYPLVFMYVKVAHRCKIYEHTRLRSPRHRRIFIKI